VTRDEAAKVLAMVQIRYPNANLGDPDLAPDVWQMTLDDVPYEAAELALRAWFKREKWAPDPSELRGLILCALAEVPEPGDAWAMALAHIRTEGLIGGRPFDGPEPVAQAVAAIGGWRALRTSEQPERDRDAFLKVYATYAKRATASLDVAAMLAERPAALNGGAR
jgi:hypothetical protein